MIIYTRSHFVHSMLIAFIIISFSGLTDIYSYAPIVTSVLMPLCVLSALMINGFSFRFVENWIFKFYFLFLLVAVLTLPLSLNMIEGLLNLQRILLMLLAILIVIEYCRYKIYDFTAIFLISIICGAIIADILLISGSTAISMSSKDRDFDVNANSYSYQNYFGLASLIILAVRNDIKKAYAYVYGFYALIIYVAFVTASRQAIIFPSFLLILYISFNNNKYRIVTLIIISLFTLIYGGSLIDSDALADTFLFQRMVSYGDDEARTRLTLDAIDVFLANPLTGVGPAQYIEHSTVSYHFSHNTYTEAAANFGIFGVSLILLFYSYPLFVLVRTISLTRSNKNFHYLMIGIQLTTLMYLTLYVFYLHIIAIFFHALAYEIIRRYISISRV